MKLFYIRNHRSAKAIESSPEALQALPSVHEQFLPKGKGIFKGYMDDPATDHVFFSGYEGLNPHIRASLKENAPAVMHGVVLDYDREISRERALEEIAKYGVADFPVRWISTTFSGGVRLIIPFEEPVKLLTKDFTKAFLVQLVQAGNFRKLLPALDEKAFLEPTMYYELGRDWAQVRTEGAVSRELLAHYQYEALRSARKDPFGDLDGVALPWDFIQEHMEKQFPGRWPGRVAEMARGPRFWDPSATNPSAAVMTAKGVFYHSDGGGFRTWASLFGHSVVQEFVADRTAAAVHNVWFDGSCYYTPKTDYTGNQRGWTRQPTRELMKGYLELSGLNPRKGKEEPRSELMDALLTIEHSKRVDFCAPHLYDRRDVVQEGGKRVLNTSDCWPIVPDDLHAGPTEWGEGFPFIAEWLGNMFGATEPQLDIFRSWLHRLYKGAVDGRLMKGQALFVVGGPNTGKTLLSTRLIGELMGGFRDASNFLMGNDMFNATIFETALVTVDDEQMASSESVRKKFSNTVKKLAANVAIEARAMYKDSTTFKWNGRVIVTLNEDPESLRMLPDISISMQDKVIILKIDNSTEFPSDVVEVIDQELAAFARYLYFYEIPEECRGSPRWGVKEYMHPDLHDEIASLADDAPIEALLDEWRKEYFKTFTERKEWEGTATDLIVELEEKWDKSIVLKDVNNRALGRKLRKMITQGVPWISARMLGGQRLYKISPS